MASMSLQVKDIFGSFFFLQTMFIFLYECVTNVAVVTATTKSVKILIAESKVVEAV